MKCPKCGYRRQIRDNAFVPATECPACGVVYAKHEVRPHTGLVRGAAITPPALKPSPVDAASLKKAQERVEKRLRKHLQSKVHDRRHAETLRLARQFTQEEMRKRQRRLEAQQDQEAVEVEPDSLVAQDQTAGSDAAGILETMTTPTVKPAEETAIQSDAQPISDVGDEPDVEPAAVVADKKTTVEAEPEIDPTSQDAPMDSEVSMETVILPPSRPQPAIDELKAQPESTRAEEVPAIEAITEPEAAEHEQLSRSSASATMDAVSTTSVKGLSRKGKGLFGILSSVAWLMLTAGIIGAILSWTTISNVEAGMRIPIPENLSAMPIGLLLGFAYLATGALGFAFFWVSSIISQQLKDIRRLLILQPNIIAASAHADDFAEDEQDENSPEA